MRNKRHRHRHYVPGRDQDAATLAARLAPPEEKQQQQQQAASAQAGARRNGGTIVVDTGALSLPEGLAKKAAPRRLFELEPVVVVIVALALAFVAFVAWRITKMPPAAADPAPNSIEQGRPSPAPGG